MGRSPGKNLSVYHNLNQKTKFFLQTVQNPGEIAMDGNLAVTRHGCRIDGALFTSKTYPTLQTDYYKASHKTHPAPKAPHGSPAL